MMSSIVVMSHRYPSIGAKLAVNNTLLINVRILLLQYLSELKFINLAYNRLEKMPTFPYEGRQNLHTLILCNNDISSVKGNAALLEHHSFVTSNLVALERWCVCRGHKPIKINVAVKVEGGTNT